MCQSYKTVYFNSTELHIPTLLLIQLWGQICCTHSKSGLQCNIQYAVMYDTIHQLKSGPDLTISPLWA